MAMEALAVGVLEAEDGEEVGRWQPELFVS